MADPPCLQTRSISAVVTWSGMGRTSGCVYLCVKLYMSMVAVEWVSLVAVISRETVVMKLSFQSIRINLRES